MRRQAIAGGAHRAPRVSGRVAAPTVSAGPPPAGAPRPAAPAHTRAQNLALLVVVTGVLIAAVDTTIVVLALPAIQRSLHVGIASVIWVIIGYLLVITVLSTQVGRLGDMFGRVRAYEAGFLVFIAGSLACALAWGEVSLIVFRLVQGVGGALLTANAGAVIADVFPREQRGRAYGYYAIGWNTGSVLGVVLGGLIVTYVSWRWVFWINVPIGLAAFAVATRVLHDSGARERHRLDWPGMVTLALGLFGLLWAMVKLTSESFDATIAGYAIGGAVLLVVFALIERVRDRADARSAALPRPDADAVLSRGDVPGARVVRRSVPGPDVSPGGASPLAAARVGAADPGLRDGRDRRAVGRASRRPLQPGAAGDDGAGDPDRA